MFFQAEQFPLSAIVSVQALAITAHAALFSYVAHELAEAEEHAYW